MNAKKNICRLVSLFAMLCIIVGCASTTNDGSSNATGSSGGSGKTITVERPKFDLNPIIVATNKTLIIEKAETEIIVDANLTESIWKQAIPMDNFTIQASTLAAPSKTVGKVAYGDDGLYFAFTGTFADNTGPSNWEGVGVSLTFDTKMGANVTAYSAYVPLTQNPEEKISMAHYGIANIYPLKIELGEFDYEASVTDTDFVAELHITYEKLGLTNFDDVKNFKLNLMRFRPFREGVSAWAPSRGFYYQHVLTQLNSDGSLTPSNHYYLFNFNIKDRFMGDIYVDTDLEFLQGGEVSLAVKNPNILTLTATHEEVSEGIDITLEMYNVNGTEMPVALENASIQGNTYSVDIAHETLENTGLYKFRLLSGNIAYDIVFDRTEILKIANNMLLEDTMEVPELKKVPARQASAEVKAVLDYLPNQTGFMFVGDPAASVNARPFSAYRFDKANPFKITSRANQKYSYPMEEGEYAYNGADTFEVNGNVVEYPYYMDENGRKFHFDAMLDVYQRDLALLETKNISEEDPLGAARLLYAFTQAYETYSPVHDREWMNYAKEYVFGDANPYWGGRWYRWWHGDLGDKWLGNLVAAYNNISDTNALEIVSEEVGEDVRKKVLAMFKDSMDYVDTYPNLNHNMDFHIWNGKAQLAQALEDPDLSHEALERIEKFVTDGFLFDGSWKEVSITYHNQSLIGVEQASQKLDGYSDPEGYVSPRTGLHVDNLNVNEQFPSIKTVRSFDSKMVYPNNYYVPVGDSWGFEQYSGTDAFAGSLLLPATQLARITKNDNQIYLTAVPKYGHDQFDSLNILLFANGEELMPDIGYTHSYLRKYTQSTLAHNTVTVNNSNMLVNGDSEDSGAITLYKEGDVVSVMSASNEKAYDGVDVYERDVVTVQLPNGGMYNLDLFNVEGGTRHEYAINGPFYRGTTATSSKKLTYYNDTLLPVGTTYEEPQSEAEFGTNSANDYYAYMYVKDVSKTDTENENVSVTFDTGNNQLKVTNLTDGNNELFLGNAYSLEVLRKTDKNRDNADAVKNFFAPKMVLRRDGENLTSNFVTLIESDSKKANSVEYTKTENGGTVVIHFGSFTDTIYFSQTNTLNINGEVHNGKIAFLRQENGVAVHFEVIGHETTVPILKTYRIALGDDINGFEVASVEGIDNAENITIIHADGTKNTYQIVSMHKQGNSYFVNIGSMETGFTYNNTTYKQDFFPSNDWTGSSLAPIATLITNK